MGRDVGRKPHGDARRPVDEKIGEAPGEHIGLLQGIVEVEREGHGLFIEIAQKFEGDGLQPRLGITHGGGGVAVHRAEVAVAVDERAPHVEVLCHTHHGVVHRSVAVRVILTHTVADDARRLLVRLIGQQPHLEHGIEDAPLHGLQTVLDAGKRSVHDDELRIREHRRREHLFKRRDEQAALRLFHLFLILPHCRPPS